MNFKIVIYCFIIVSIISCSHHTENSDKQYFIESHPSFFDLNNENLLSNEWLRNPENLLMLHETFKKFGYNNLITGELFTADEIVYKDIYLKKSGIQLLDSLELTYNNPKLNVKYYTEFWQRRKNEKNDSVVFTIIKDINKAFKNKMSSFELSNNTNPNLVNDTLIKLLTIKFRNDTLNNNLALQDFSNLKKYGLHQSAHNLFFDYPNYVKLKLNNDSLFKTLITTSIEQKAWFKAENK